ncbi:sn-glycerol-3-phosphate transport system permease protein UgpA [subsurface metagenome]
MAAASMIWLWLFNPSYGIINILIGKLGFPAHIDWVNDGNYSLLAIIIVAIWKYIGYYTIIFLAGLQSIDNEYYEAAAIEGTTSCQKFRYITFPLLTPTTFFVVILSIINSFQSVDQVYVMTHGGPYDSSNVLLYYIYENAFTYGDLGYGSTLSFFLLLTLLLGTVFYFLGLNKWVSYER